jgi:hypothetical protein
MKKTILVTLALVVALSITACNQQAQQEVEEEAGALTAQEIADGVIESLDDTRTYQFDMDMTMDIAGEAEGESIEMIMEMDSSGAFDLDDRQMMMDITMIVAVPEEDEMEMGMEMYLVDDMMHIMMEIPFVGAMWMKAEVPAESWQEVSGEMNQIESLVGMLSTAQVKVTGSEIVGGTDCYVVELTPDVEQLWQMAMQQVQQAGEIAEFPDVTEELLSEMFRDFSVKYWIAKDTYYIAKMDMIMDIELTPEAMGFPEEEGVMTMDIAMSMLMYNYNQPVNIVLPPEAEDAIEVPLESIQ